ncbi:MAG: sugar phosphate isomerase/epimerase family protein [Nevskiales bacterium]
MNPLDTKPNSAGLILYAGTVAGKRFDEQLVAARSGRFSAISLFPQVYWKARHAGHSDADLRAMLSEHGVTVSAVEPLLNWVPGEAFPGSSLLTKHMPSEDAFYRLADAIGASNLIVVWARKKRMPENQLIDAFGGLCQRAARHGLQVHLEFLPWTQVCNIKVALRLVTAAAQANGGVMFDSWHHYRSGGGVAELQGIDGRLISAVQLSDAPEKAGRFLQIEALRGRRLPGEGDINLPAITQALLTCGCAAPWGIEVFSSRLRKLDATTLGAMARASLDRCTPISN